MKKRIVVAGATGLVGSQLVDALARALKRELHVLARRETDKIPDGIHFHVAPTEKWPTLVQQIKPEIAISCLGTTLKTAGSREAFRQVDHDLVLAFAKAAKQAGACQMISVSSVGAMTASSSFYLRTKAEAEQGLRALDFNRLDILRPSLLTGGVRSETRTGESVAIMLSPFTDLLMIGPLRKYASTQSARVAQAIAALTKAGDTGEFIHENDSIDALAG